METRAVQSCITAISYPDSIEGLISMADWHKEESGRWETDLESILNETRDDCRGYWTGPRWMTEGDVLFFYQTLNARWNARRLLKRCRKLHSEDTRLIDQIERSLKLIDRYGGTVFACAEVDGQPEYFDRDEGDDFLHFRNRIFVPFNKPYVFDFPLGGEELKRCVRLSTGGSITPLGGADFIQVKEELGRKNGLPPFLEVAQPGGLSFRDVSRETWREISCSLRQRFIDESQLRSYLLDYLLDEMKDSQSPLLQECDCFRSGLRTGRADYFVRINGRWVPIEAILNIRCEHHLINQVNKYLEIDYFQPTKGMRRGRCYSPSAKICVVADQFGIYITNKNDFVLGSQAVPAWRRDELTKSALTDIRETISQLVDVDR